MNNYPIILDSKFENSPYYTAYMNAHESRFSNHHKFQEDNSAVSSTKKRTKKTNTVAIVLVFLLSLFLLMSFIMLSYFNVAENMETIMSSTNLKTIFDTVTAWFKNTSLSLLQIAIPTTLAISVFFAIIVTILSFVGLISNSKFHFWIPAIIMLLFLIGSGACAYLNASDASITDILNPVKKIGFSLGFYIILVLELLIVVASFFVHKKNRTL